MQITTHEEAAAHHVLEGRVSDAITALAQQHSLEDLRYLRGMITSIRAIYSHNLNTDTIEAQQPSPDELIRSLSQADSDADQWLANLSNLTSEQRVGFSQALTDLHQAVDAAAVVVASAGRANQT